MNIYQKLMAVQAELKAPKGQRNSFGNYNYRSCEDIMEAVKPLLQKHEAALVVGDTIELIGTRFYVKATAKFIDVADGTEIENIAYAREEDSKKGMDAAQVTGAASSYARKYCLNGLFDIDDTKDADTDEYQKQQSKGSEKPAQKPAEKAESKYVKIENNETYVLTRAGYKKPSELNLSTLQQMYSNKLYQEAQFVIQLAINDKEAEQPA